MTGPRNPKLMHLFAAFEREAELTHRMLAEQTGFTPDVARKTLDNARYFDFVERTERKDGMASLYRLTAKGIERAAQFRGGAAPVRGDQDAQALALIDAAPAGLDSEALAEALGLARPEVEMMLAKHVSEHRLTSCGLQRMVDGDLIHMLLYRKSMAGRSTCGDVRIPEFAPAVAPKPDDVAEPPVRAEVAQAAAAPAVAEPLDSVTRIKLPVFECDIDAVHRHQVAHADAELEVALKAEDEGFMVALYSNDVLWIQLSGGQQISIDAEDTRRLFQYLDRLGRTSLVETLACA